MLDPWSPVRDSSAFNCWATFPVLISFSVIDSLCSSPFISHNKFSPCLTQFIFHHWSVHLEKSQVLFSSSFSIFLPPLRQWGVHYLRLHKVLTLVKASLFTLRGIRNCGYELKKLYSLFLRLMPRTRSRDVHFNWFEKWLHCLSF